MLDLRLSVLASVWLSIALAPAAAGQYVPRHEQGESEALRRTVLDANRVHLTVANTGLAGGVGEVGAAWPAGEVGASTYLGSLLPVVAARVVADGGAHVWVAQLPRGPWGGMEQRESSLEAVPAYLAPSPPPGPPGTPTWARSDRAASWPALWPDRMGDTTDPGWPGAWNGLLGKNAIIPGAEAFGHAADNGAHRHGYTPDPEFPARGGLGVVIGHRALAWHDPALEDVVVLVYDLYNASPKALDSLAFGLLVSPRIEAGGTGSGSEVLEVDAARHLAYWRRSALSDPGALTGSAGLAYLQTPAAGGGEVGLTGVSAWYPSGLLRIHQDHEVAAALHRRSTAGAFPEACEPYGCAFGMTLASATIPMPPFSQDRFVVALVLGESPDHVQSKTDLARAFVRGGYTLDGPLAVSVGLPEVSPGTVTLNWTGGGSGDRVHLAYSLNDGGTWYTIAAAEPNTGSYAWTPTGGYSGSFRARVLVYNTQTLGSAVSAGFSVQAERGVGAGSRLALHAPYPNPTREPVLIVYETAQGGTAVLEVLDPLGRRVAALARSEHGAGRHELTWDPGDLRSGTYVLRLRAGGEVVRQRVTILR